MADFSAVLQLLWILVSPTCGHCRYCMNNMAARSSFSGSFSHTYIYISGGRYSKNPTFKISFFGLSLAHNLPYKNSSNPLGLQSSFIAKLGLNRGEDIKIFNQYFTKVFSYLWKCMPPAPFPSCKERSQLGEGFFL